MNKLIVEFNKITPNEVERLMAGLYERGYDATIVEQPKKENLCTTCHLKAIKGCCTKESFKCSSYKIKKLLTLPEYIKEHGWPKWAKYAVVHPNGILVRSDTKPIMRKSSDKHNNHMFWDCCSVNSEGVEKVHLDTTNWQNSLVEKCDTCNGSGRIKSNSDSLLGTIYTCTTCNGTKIKPKQEDTRTKCTDCEDNECFVSDITRRNCGKHPNNKPKQEVKSKYKICAKHVCYIYETGCPKCNQENDEAAIRNDAADPKLKSLAEEPWPDPNEEWLRRKTDHDGYLVMTKLASQVLADWDIVPDAGHFAPNQPEELHPRYDDSLWLRQWKGKKVWYSGVPQVAYTVLRLANMDGVAVCNSEKEALNLEICKLREWKEPKRVPLTAKDYRNIRALILDDNGEEGRIQTILLDGLYCIDDKKLLFEKLVTLTYRGITYDNKIVPLYKEE